MEYIMEKGSSSNFKIVMVLLIVLVPIIGIFVLAIFSCQGCYEIKYEKDEYGCLRSAREIYSWDSELGACLRQGEILSEKQIDAVKVLSSQLDYTPNVGFISKLNCSGCYYFAFYGYNQSGQALVGGGKLMGMIGSGGTGISSENCAEMGGRITKNLLGRDSNGGTYYISNCKHHEGHHETDFYSSETTSCCLERGMLDLNEAIILANRTCARYGAVKDNGTYNETNHVWSIPFAEGSYGAKIGMLCKVDALMDIAELDWSQVN